MVNKQLNEPADHIAIELDFFGNLIIRSNELESETELEDALLQQDNFIQTQLLSWTPKFAEKCQTLDKFGFYSALTLLLVAFLQLDSSYLKGE
jgi:TorA-specific chaperone